MRDETSGFSAGRFQEGSARRIPLSGWGRYPRALCALIDARGSAEILAAIAANATLIPRGNGRSYGDASLNASGTLSMLRSDRLIDFDAKTGSLTCEAGVLLSDVIDVFLPRGWFPPVTPGTKYVTIGGMIASDVHGKNHHAVGSFGNHVESFELALADGRVVHCSPTENASLFKATCGGMGLTGVILRATFRMMPVETTSIRRETVRARNLDEAMAQFEASSRWSYSVAWIDCIAKGDALGRSILFRGEHAKRDELDASSRASPLAMPRRREQSLPAAFPSIVLNRWSVAAFNAVYYRRARSATELQGYEGFFYPLDGLRNWTLLYGRPGLIQYQCVLPKPASRAGLEMLLRRVTQSGLPSFLGVLKLLGSENGWMSFPMEGYTLALDFPAGAATLSLLRELDAIVADHGGRVYLAKDACASGTVIERFYPKLEEFRALRAKIDPGAKFSSLQSQRLGL